VAPDISLENPQESESTVGGPPGQVTVTTPLGSEWTVATGVPDASSVVTSCVTSVPASAPVGKVPTAFLLKQSAPFFFT
jgi:hypothetical protein